MKSITGKILCKLLEKKGWQCARITGSHHIYVKKGTVIRISVPVHGNKDIKSGLLKALLKTAEINENELKDL